MAKPPADDPFEFDPMAEPPRAPAKELELKLEFDPRGGPDEEGGEIAPPPPEDDEVMPPPRASGGLDAGSLFGDDPQPTEPEVVAPVPKREDRPLNIDFNELLPVEQARGALRVGASTLDTSEFLSKDDKEAMARAKRQPRDQPLELSEDREGAVRVVAEDKSIWLYFALGTLAVLALMIGGLILFQKSRDVSSAAELNELRSADRHLREADQKRESEVTH